VGNHQPLGRAHGERAHRRFHAGRPDTAFDQPNAIWTADFKGQFRTGNGVYCYPLTVQDGATRFESALPNGSRLSCGRPAR